MNTPGERSAGAVLLAVLISVVVAQVVAYFQSWAKGREGDER